MYKEITKEDFDRVFDEAVLRQESKERQYIIYSSKEGIEALEKAVEELARKEHNALWWSKKS